MVSIAEVAIGGGDGGDSIDDLRCLRRMDLPSRRMNLMPFTL